MRQKYFKYIVIGLLLISFVAGIVFEVLYHASANEPLNKEAFIDELSSKQSVAERKIDRIKEILNTHSADSLFNYHFGQKEISFYVLNSQNELVYWSSNFTDITNLPLQQPNRWVYFASSNAHCISFSTPTKQGTLAAVIRIKNNYPFQNNQLINSYSDGFKIDDKIDIEPAKISEELAVTDKAGNYLFSFKTPTQPVLNQFYGVTGFIFQFVCLLCLLIILIRIKDFLAIKSLSLNNYLAILGITAVIVLASLYFKFPHLLYFEVLSSAFDYSSGFLLASIIHLTILTLFILVFAYLFFQQVYITKIRKYLKSIVLQLVTALFFVLIFYVLKGLVLHSGIPINILSLHDFDKGVVWLHFLMLLWGISLALLFFKTHNFSLKAVGLRQMIWTDLAIFTVLGFLIAFFDSIDTNRITIFLLFLNAGFYIPYIFPRLRNYYFMSAVWVLCFTIFLVENSAMLTKKKNESKYKVLAENIFLNGNTESDKVTEILLAELNNQISNDKELGLLVQKNDSVDSLLNYLTGNYLRGYWNKYNVQLAVVRRNSLQYSQNRALIESTGIPVQNTNFYALTSRLNDMTYMGEFVVQTTKNEEVSLFLTLTPRRNFKSYSFPNFLISSESDIQAKLKIAIARYYNGLLVYSSGNYKFKDNSNYIPHRENLFYKFNYSGQIYYVYQPDSENSVVITELNSVSFLNYLVYFAYILLANIVLSFIFVWLAFPRRRTVLQYSRFSTRYQLSFAMLLLVSFIGIFYVSVTFISSKYKEQQITEINKKKRYIQNALQEKYYWIQDISLVNEQGLNFDLQELAYMYQTDINVYDNSGRLVGSSQPLIYNKSLIGRQIAPEPFFGTNSNINQQEYIGELRFQTGYTDLYNGDFLQIGYIAIPLYVSNDEIRKEIEDFLAVIIHIYLIIALLSVVLSFIIGKQLSAPLKMIENKLRQMRFGQRNEKIDYNENDEIGQLVKQYNKTIEELEKSAGLLAQTERETAWRTMARQIAHEINNPLTPMKLTLQQLQRTKRMNDDRFDEYFEKSTETLVEQIDNLSRIAGTFSNFARMPEARFERFDIASKLYLTTQLFSANNEAATIRYNGPTENIFVHADPEQMIQVFNNLFKNALQAIPAEREGEITVSLTTSDNQVVITVADNGIGIDNELYDSIFTPNFTTKSTGMGLGLSVSKNIIENAGGKISFTTEKNAGSIFKVELREYK